MSEIILGALIGIGGAIVGATITAVIAYINTKSQLNLRIYELQTDRLIQAREQVLKPLREALSNSLELANNAIIMSVRMVEAQKRGDKKEDVQKEIRRWEEISNKATEASNILEKLKGQVSDVKLCRLVEDAIIAQENENINIVKITKHVNNPESIKDLDAIEASLAELKEVRKRILNSLLPVNKRIEELLSGVPSS